MVEESGPVIFYFSKLKISFTINGNKISLKGTTKNDDSEFSLKPILKHSLKKFFNKSVAYVSAALFSITVQEQADYTPLVIT